MAYKFVNIDLIHQQEQLLAKAQEQHGNVQVLISEITSALTRKGINQQLVELTMSVLSSVQSPNAGVYVLELVQSLHLLVSHGSDSEIEDQLHEVLFRYNFNSSGYMEYYVNKLTAALKTCDTIEQQLTFLYKKQKQVMQYFQDPHFIHHPKLPTPKQQVLSWLSAEIDFLTVVQALQAGPTQNTTGHPVFKILVNLSVAQLACLTRMLVDAGVIKSTNHAAMFRFFAQHFTTKKAENISPDSFSRRYYDIEDGVRDAVRQMLQSLLKR